MLSLVSRTPPPPSVRRSLVAAARQQERTPVLQLQLQQQPVHPAARSIIKLTSVREPSVVLGPTVAWFSTNNSNEKSSTSKSTSHEDAMSLAQSQNSFTQQPTTTTTSSSTSRSSSWFGKLLNRLSIKNQQQRIVLGEELYQAAFRQANDPRWYGPGRIPRTFRSRHAMITMHLWFLHKRLIASNVDNGPLLCDADTCLAIQEELFEILWNDTLCRIRGEGVREMSVNKSLLKVQQYTFLHLFHYDHIYQSLASSQSHLDAPDDDDDTHHSDGADDTTAPALPRSNDDHDGDDPTMEGMDPLSVLDPSLDLTQVGHRITELKKLIWMHILVRDPHARGSDDHLTRLAWYIEAQYQNILVDWPGRYASQARVAWVDLPDFSNLRDDKGRLVVDRPVHAEDVLPKPWLTNITLRGETYYWNPQNGKSQWERPTGLLEKQRTN